MSTQQTITYAKPDFIQKAQQDLLNSIADYIASKPNSFKAKLNASFAAFA